LVKVGVNAPPAKASTPRKRSAVWSASLLALSGVAQAGLNEDLFVAVKKGNLQEVQRLVSAGADVNVKDDVGNTPLHWTAGMGWAM